MVIKAVSTVVRALREFVTIIKHKQRAERSQSPVVSCYRRIRRAVDDYTARATSRKLSEYEQRIIVLTSYKLPCGYVCSGNT